ncbi:hypothetical protein F4055_16790 [Candidatus Poribacteria bacterium]|nr:hypothetical protein [Candidatus Poribacteria bacterium]
MRSFFLMTGIALLILCQLSCSPDEEQAKVENPVTDELITGLNAAPLLGDVVLENMYEDEARKLTDKTPVQIVTVLEGTSRVVLEARFRGVRDFGFGFPLYECELMDASAEAMGGIAQGMSGSPVGPPGRIMGALAYGNAFPKTPTRFWVTSIDAMEATIDHQTLGGLLDAEPAPAAPGVGINATYVPVKTPVMVTGIQSHRIQELSSHLSDSRYNFIELFADIGNAPAAPPAGSSRGLAPGDMIGAAIATGDIVNSIGFGTVTQVYDDKFVAFGHPFFYDGQSALPVYRAVVNGIVPNYQISYKSVSAYGNPIGTITKDLTPAIVGELGAPPSMIPVKVSYHPANSETAIEKHHQVAYGQESFISLVAAITLDSLRMELSNSTIEGAVTLQFEETNTVYTEPFRRTSPVAFLDVLLNVDQIVRSFADTLSNSAGKATLKAVSISLTDKPQIAKAEIAEVIAPEEIMPGESITVGITLVPHWSTAGAARTIQREVVLEIPEDFPAGEANINVSASSFDFFGDLGPIGPPPGAIVDFGFGGFGDEEERPVPQTLDELIKQMEEDQIDPGLITVTLTPPGSGFPGLPPDLLPPDGFPPLDGLLPPDDGDMPDDGEEDGDDGEMPDDGEEDGDGNEMPGDFPFPEGFPGLDALGIPEDVEPPEPIEAELTIDGFVVTGARDTTVIIKGEEMDAGMLPPMEGEAPMEPAEPVEEE